METSIDSSTKRSLRDVGRLAIWTLVWIGTLAVAQFGPELVWGDNPVATWVAIGVNLIAGAIWIVVHARYLGGVDDLQRKIMMDAIAVALGVGLVIGFALATAQAAHLIAIDSDIALLTALMAVVYIVGVAIGTVRYR